MNFIFMASARVFVMGQWVPPETCRFPAVFRTLEPISTSFLHIGGKVHPPKNSLLRFLRGVKRFLINSFFIRSEMDRILCRSGVLGCPALLRLLSASFDPFFACHFKLFSHFPRTSPESILSHEGGSMGLPVFFTVSLKSLRRWGGRTTPLPWFESRVREHGFTDFLDFLESRVSLCSSHSLLGCGSAAPSP